MSEINLNPVEDYLKAQHLNALVEQWVLLLDVLPDTRASYRNKIAHFTRWWDNVGPAHDWRLTKTLLREFEIHLRGALTKRFGRPMAYSHRHAIVWTVRMMFKWAAATERTVKNYSEWVPWPTGDTPPRKSATPGQLARLMLAAAESPQPLRDQTLLAFFIGTGCRRGEATALNVEDLTILADGSGTAQVTGKRTPANETGRHAVAFDASTGKWLIRYMDEMVITSGPLWLGQWGEPMSVQGVYLVVKRAVARAGLTGIIRGCHDLRRAFATILGRMHPDSPGWADMIRRQLGHKHYSMTAHYTLIEVDDIRDMIVTPLSSDL